MFDFKCIWANHPENVSRVSISDISSQGRDTIANTVTSLSVSPVAKYGIDHFVRLLMPSGKFAMENWITSLNIKHYKREHHQERAKKQPFCTISMKLYIFNLKK
jgi:hypothetical protein